MTIGDIIIFNEISQFFEMTGHSVGHPDVAQYACLAKWFTSRMASDPEISALDKEMKDTLAK